MGMLELGGIIYIRRNRMVLWREEQKIGYCGNVGCHEPASRHNTKDREYNQSPYPENNVCPGLYQMNLMPSFNT